MEQRLWKKIGVKTSLLGFGMMRLPVREGGEIDEGKTREMVDLAFESGVNYYDTAYAYHRGKSEEVTGRALSGYPRGSYFLANKLPLWLLKEPGDREAIFEEQLRRCGTDYFDFYLAHNINKPLWEIAQKYSVYDFLLRKRAEGRIRHIGFSFHEGPELLREVLNAYDWDFAQLQVNYMDWELQNARTLYELVEAKGISCVVMEPLKGGALAALCEESREILQSAAPGSSIASWGMRYAGSLPGVPVVLSGMTAIQQVKDNIGTFSRFQPLLDEERRILHMAGQAYWKKVTVPCTGCRYCMDCPFGVDIPGMMDTYNDYAIGGNKVAFAIRYNNTAEKARADRCTGCGECTGRCPQRLDVPGEMKRIGELAVSLQGYGI